MEKLAERRPLGKTGLEVPPIIFGTSSLGNLYQALPYETKLEIVEQCFETVAEPVALDTAGKYGAGLALEILGRTLRDLGKTGDDVILSNKLGWKRVPLKGPEPTFEPGAWADIDHDAEQCISYEGIIECHQQGCELLGEPFAPQVVSVHDPDEYLAAASDPADRRRRLADVVGAYKALHELKAAGKVAAVGVGSKDWTVIGELADKVDLDWVMFACSLTIYTHPIELVQLMERLNQAGVGLINSAVFNAGFLIGGSFFDYRRPDPSQEPELFEWREKFLAACTKHDVEPAVACVQFGMSVPGMAAVALNTSKPARIADNVRTVATRVPQAFWNELRDHGMIDKAYPYV